LSGAGLRWESRTLGRHPSDAHGTLGRSPPDGHGTLGRRPRDAHEPPGAGGGKPFSLDVG